MADMTGILTIDACYPFVQAILRYLNYESMSLDTVLQFDQIKKYDIANTVEIIIIIIISEVYTSSPFSSTRLVAMHLLSEGK
jgi:hypothetical protein